MILGIGSDLTDVRRIEKTLERFGERFAVRLFTDEEREKADRHARPASVYAKRFAAKEACAKALGTGIGGGVFFRDIGVVNLPSGQPTLRLTGGALKRLAAITPESMKAVLHLTISDDGTMAQAAVVIEAQES